MPKFSIITVCYNAKDTIESTIKSVVEQEYKDYEYIIIDGGSTDGTLNIIQDFCNRHICIRYVSEPDKGLYDAMNKGIAMASGDYIEFLNSGDVFFAKDVLQKVSDSIGQQSGKKIYYGNITYVNADGSENVRLYGTLCSKPLYYATGDCVNHQACFASKTCFDGGELFNDVVYRICADRDWMMRQSKKGTEWIALNEMVVKYSLDEESVSIKNTQLLRAEERMTLKKHFPMMYPIYLIFDFCRNNIFLAKILHGIYKMLYIR